jgi:hypothetical protein
MIHVSLPLKLFVHSHLSDIHSSAVARLTFEQLTCFIKQVAVMMHFCSADSADYYAFFVQHMLMDHRIQSSKELAHAMASKLRCSVE